MTDPTLLSQVTKPGRYLGSEYNSVTKPWQDADVRCALVFPDLYEIGMSHQGLQILYHLLNGRKRILAERCYCPDRDVEALLRQTGQPLTSLESGRPLADFDLIGITLPYELCYTNILTILDLAGIPLLAAGREQDHPLILGGGACAMNPEPVADFFDAVLLGDGEEAIVEIAQHIATARKGGFSRKQILEDLAKIEGVYVPGHFLQEYDDNGKLIRTSHTGGGRAEVRRRVLPDLSATDHLLHPIVPNAKIVHDRLGIEIARGCTRGCRFCQAGITYRPVRERSPEQLIELARKGIDNSGFEELALLSLSTGDYSCLGQLLPKLMDSFADRFVSVAMPSMRVGTLTPEIMDQIRRVRKTGFTLAPEAGSERLRRVINKGITEEDLLESCRTAFSLGWNLMKFYFMIGLPTETREDVEAIIELVRKAGAAISGVGRGRKQINVSVGTFVPKPHTPFQWSRQLTIEESQETIRYLKQNLPRKGCQLKYHSPEQSFLEGIFSRGDRRLAVLVSRAWQLGARLDGWNDHFDLNIWHKAAADTGIVLEEYLRERRHDELLPWDHLSTGVDRAFFQQEWLNAVSEIYTPDCRYHGCQGCGLCDFETLQPIVHADCEPGSGASPPAAPRNVPIRDRRDIPAHEENHFKYMVTYSRQGNICYLGHLEFLQLIFRGLRRAGITTNFSKGFNPSPKVSFAPALPVGTISHSEYFIMDLPELLPDPAETARLLGSKLPPGLEVLSIVLHSGNLPELTQSSYTLQLPRPLTSENLEAVTRFMASEHVVISRSRKGKTREIDIRELIVDVHQVSDDTLAMQILQRTAAPGIKPSDGLQHILGIDPQEALAAIVTKTGWEEVSEK